MIDLVRSNDEARHHNEPLYIKPPGTQPRADLKPSRNSLFTVNEFHVSVPRGALFPMACGTHRRVSWPLFFASLASKDPSATDDTWDVPLNVYNSIVPTTIRWLIDLLSISNVEVRHVPMTVASSLTMNTTHISLYQCIQNDDRGFEFWTPSRIVAISCRSCPLH